MKKLAFIAGVLVLVLTTVYAGGGAEDSQTKKIGFVSSNFNDTGQTFTNRAAQEYADSQPNLEMTQVDAQEDVIRQQDLVNTFIAQGVDALIVVPVDTSAMDPITKAAQDAEIPICYVNRNPYANKAIPEGVYYVGSEEIVAGQLQMEYIGEKIGGTGGVAILMGKLDNEGALKRTEGNKQVIAEKYPSVKVLAEETGNWQRDQGLSLTENWITAYGSELSAILANNDEMALGAVEALKAANIDIPVIGVDAIPDARVAVRDGTLDATVLQDQAGQGREAAKLIDMILQGNMPSEQVLWIPFELITPENIADFL